MDDLQAQQLFAQEVLQPDPQIDLAKAALYMGLSEYPNLDVEEYLNSLDTMAAELQERLPPVSYPLRVIQVINRYLYEDLGFQGNQENYYDPRNSFLNEVIDRRTGIPISLSLVYLEVARRIDFPMVGIGMPGHFLIRPNVAEMEIFVDPFNQGEVLFPEDCQERLTEVYGRPVALKPEFLQIVTPRQFLIRMLANLKAIYFNRGDFPRALATLDRILLTVPNAPLELRDRGILHFRLNHWNQARQDLETYLTLMPTAEDKPVIRQLLEQMEPQ
ncbi:MAG: SirB1 family protein [Scytolyngbya sp. HA4215-MV1]|jgi:regulator of sirC expression with transglutaminase-like and TPR domain|nr:SirB1 family protein [Scytolyngbya sp. HA4215-MV1]